MDSGITWINEPLSQIFVQIENGIVGVIPGNFTEPTGADYSMLTLIFSLIKSGLLNNDLASIQSASSLAKQANYQLLAINDSDTGHKFLVLREDAAFN